jgi:C_GCAxxG_C_C family probable redox protein
MKKDRAKETFETMSSRKMNCAQTVLTAFCEDFGMERKLALEMAQGFGGGMGHTGQTCGAVTGAYMVLGLAHKISPDNPRNQLEKTYELISEFNRKFKELHKYLNCSALTRYDLSKPDDLAEARAKGVFNTVCPVLVRDSAKILEELLKLS